MEIFVYSRDAIARIRPHEVPHVIISITSAVDDVARFPVPATCVDVLRLAFVDVLPTEATPATSLLFGHEHALRIWAFVDKYRSAVDRIVVHCDAGRSRSAAVAAAIARALDLDDEEFFRRYEPNRHVYDVLVSARASR